MQPTPTRSPDREALHLGADAGDPPDDLVAGHHREDRAAPLVPGLVDVGVADAAVVDVDDDVPGATGRRSISYGASGLFGSWAA